MLTTLADRVVRHPRRWLLAVLAFVLVAAVVGGPVVGRLSDDGGFTPADSGSARATERIEAATGRQAAPGVVALAPAAQAAQVARDLQAIDGVAAAQPAGTSRDGDTALVAATLRADADEAAVVAAAEARLGERPGVELGGPAVANEQLGTRVEEDLGRAEMLALPLLVLLSIVFFRGRAAWLPLLVGITTVLGTFLALSAINELTSLSIFAVNLVIGLGLGLAIDYTLFLVSRFREELDAQGPGAGAVRATMQTAGRTVAFSAATVAIALSTLTVFPLGFLQSMGIAGAVVSIVAAVAALVVSPALFAVWGAKLARPQQAQSGAWYRLSHAVMRRPGAIAAVTAAVMAVLALPALRAEWTPVDDAVIPADLSARVVADRLATEFDGQGTTPTVAVVADPADGERLARLDGVVGASEPKRLGAGAWQVDLQVAGAAEGATARAVVDQARATTPLVAGPAADFVDQQEAMGSRLWLAGGLLATLTFAVLWLMTGSVVLPLKAILMNVLTVGTALGALTFVYQDGRLTDLLNYTPNGGIEPADFLVAAALVFALSTDYGVFLLGRIKEARDNGLPEREAVTVGLARTGRVVTAAAILLAVAIGAFSTSSISFIQQIGVATAVGVLVDAFVVRALLVPALMALLGRWNWWSPMWARRVHDRVGIREAALPSAA